MTHPATLIERLELRLRSAPEAPTFDGRSLASLRTDALRVALALRERGLAGQPVLVAAAAGVEYVTCLLGCLYSGAIAVPAYPATATRLTRANRRIASILADARVACALGVGQAPALRLPHLELSTLLAEAAAPPELTWSLQPDAVCLLQYTSGSTSAPKGIAVSLRQLSANLDAITTATQLTSKDVLVTWLPPYHDMGLLGGILWPLFAGVSTTVLSPDAFIRRPLRWLQAITQQRATVTMAPNFAFDLCVQRIPEARRAGLDLSSLRVVGNGAEPIRPDTLDAFATAFEPYGFDRRAFFPCYGLAEATLFVSGGAPGTPTHVQVLDAAELEQHRARPARPDGRARRIVSCGRAGANLRVAIVSPDTQQRLSDNQVGEIWVSGASVATGYWNRPDETRAHFRAPVRDSSEGPFLRTGDLGFLSNGELFVTGRLKELIVVRGQNHYPHDLERTVRAVDPSLRSMPSAAFSVESGGQERAVVVQELDQRIPNDPARVITQALEAVRQEHGLTLHGLVLVKRGSVARTASGKVQRSLMRRAYAAGALDVIARWDASADQVRLASVAAAGSRDPEVTRTLPAGSTRRADAIARFLRERVARIARIAPEDVDPRAPLGRYAIDSLHAAELSVELEQFLGEAVPATISYEQPSIAAIAHALAFREPAPLATRTGGRTPARDESIAIIGMSCRFPAAPNLERFWELLVHGRDAITELPVDRPQLAASGARFGGFIDGIDRFDPAFFEISEREAARMDPQQRLFLELTWAALEDAGIPPSSLRETDAGVFAGVCTSDYALLHAGQLSLVDADYGAGHAPSVVANRVSYTLDLRGPSMTVDSACSSALVALHLASESLRRGECSVAIVGGVNAVLAAEPGLFFAKARALAKDGRCKAFDASADGFVRSEGCGVIVLKRSSDAKRANDRIYALIEGSATNHDGCSNGLMAPSLPAQERLVRAALRAAGVEPQQVDYVEAHGVGTLVSDAVELRALGRVLGRTEAGEPEPCWVGSVKTNLGHLEAASGIAGVIKTALALEREHIPAHLHLDQISDEVDLGALGLAIPTRTRAWPRSSRARIAGVSAFGFGGTNAHVVLRESPAPTDSAPAAATRTRELLGLSAKDPEALCTLAASLSLHVTETNWRAVCFTMNAGRDHFAHRAAILAEDLAELRTGLARIADRSSSAVRRREPRIAFVFDELRVRGGAARELYATEPVFRAALDRAAQITGDILRTDVRGELISESAGLRLAFPQTGGLIVQHALHALLEHWQVTPSVVVGQGTGEYVAASTAGAIAWTDALRIAARRELLLMSLIPGALVRQTLAQFKRAVAEVQHTPLHLPLVAAGLDRRLGLEETLPANYWVEHLYARVDPACELAALQELDPQLVLRIGHAAASDDPAKWLACLDAGGSPRVLESVATLYEHGATLDFCAFHSGFEREKLALPSYPFQRRRCWLDVSRPETESAVQSTHPYLRANPR